MSQFLELKKHNCENIISYSATILALVGMFRSLHYVQDLTSATFLGQAVQKLPPNLKESWAVHTVNNKRSRPTLLKFNDCLKEKPEAHERMKVISSKPKTDEFPHAATKTKTASKLFASLSRADALIVEHSVLPTKLVSCIDC